MISIQNISKSYHSHQALQDINIEIEKGSIYGLIGHNGAGKTTLIRILTQIIKPDSGTISINGETLSPKHRLEIGYLPEERGLYKKMKLKEYLQFLGNLRSMEKSLMNERIDFWLNKFDLKEIENKEINALSKGNQQKVQFIATVFFDPSILILDEPFSGFDPANVELLKREILALHKKGVTIIFSTHQMEAVEELCKELSMIDRSKIVLSGKLAVIKKAFGSQEIYLKSNVPLELSSAFDVKEYKQGYKVKLRESQTKKELMNHLEINDLQIFEELEPSLREIFLSKVKQ